MRSLEERAKILDVMEELYTAEAKFLLAAGWTAHEWNDVILWRDPEDENKTRQFRQEIAVSKAKLQVDGIIDRNGVKRVKEAIAELLAAVGAKL